MAESAICPVCGMKVEKDRAAGSVVYNGDTYYFCDAMCQRKFEENPEEYVDKGM
ncbi:MAG: YHS domain-containing protein [Gemmatimonadales bacterium]|nr:YHS domain-containing protein [Gemmatimonadales bacterium]